MRNSFTIAILFAVATSLASIQTPARLIGCPDSASIAAGLAKVRDAGWGTVNRKQLETIWPTKLDALDCDSEACTSVWSMGRIIRGDCECCEIFVFDVKHEGNFKHEGSLSSFVIHYTVREGQDAVSIARGFAVAAGLPAAESGSIGLKEPQHLQWDHNAGTMKQSFGAELSVVPKGRLTKIYFSVAVYGAEK